MKSKDEILECTRDWFKDAKDHQRDWRNEAKENYDFYAGRQWTDDEQAEMEEQLRPPITFNRIQPMVAAVKGQFINNRLEMRYYPREQGDVQVNEMLTGAAQWADDECDAEDELTEVFEDLCITGMGWSETRISYDEDMDGKIHTAERVSPLEMYWDHTAKRKNLGDAKYLMRGRWISRKEAETRWTELKGKDFTETSDEPLWDEDEGFQEPHDAAKAHFYENDFSQWYNKHKDQVFVVQVQWWEHAPTYRVADPATGKLIEIDDERFSKLKDALEEQGIKYIRQLKKVYYEAFVVGPFVVDAGDSPCPNAFTLRCVTGKRDAQKKHWFGLVRGMVDPQRWANKFYSDIEDMITSNRLGGAFIEQSALVDPRQAEEIWNDPNPLIQVQDGAISRGAIMERNPINYPQGMDRMMEWAVNALPAVTGINLEMMGFADRDQPNVLEVQRKKSALGVLADLFDSMRRFNKERARVVLYFIQEYISDGRLIRILGENNKEQYVPLWKDPEARRYDVVVDEAASSVNQKEETFAVLMQLAPFLTSAGIPPPVETLDYLPLPASFTAAWKQQLEPKPPSKMEQVAVQRQIAEAKEAETEAPLNMAEARKKMAEAEAQELENEFVKRLGVKPGNA
jgi:hypothetical protein